MSDINKYPRVDFSDPADVLSTEGEVREIAEAGNQGGEGAAQDVAQQGVPATNHPVFEFVTSAGEGTLNEHGVCSFIELIYVVLPNAIHAGHTLMVREVATVEVPNTDVEVGSREKAEFEAARLREAMLHAQWAEANGVEVPEKCQAVLDAAGVGDPTRTISLGTPSTITETTTNAVSPGHLDHHGA